MADESPSLTALLNELESTTEQIDERYVLEAISKFRQDEDPGHSPLEWSAETIAFQFKESYIERESPWGTYFCPMMVLPNNDGTTIEVPSLRQITQDIMNYWSARTEQSIHPLFKARYADLVWDLSKVVTGTPASYLMAQVAIDSIVEIAWHDCYPFKFKVVRKLKRALSLALSLGDANRITTVRDAIIAYEDNIAEDSKRGLWGFSYDLIFYNKKIPLSESHRQKLINDLEERLVRLSTPTAEGAVDAWGTEHATLRLADYYQRNDCQEDLKRVLRTFGTAWEHAAKRGSPLQGSFWLQRVHSIYLQYGLAQEAENIVIKVRQIGPEVEADLKPITAECEIPREEFNRYISAMTEGDLATVLHRIIIQYIPRRDDVARQLLDLAKKAPLSFLSSIQIQDYKGRPVATVGPLEDDLDGHIVRQMTQNMQISYTFLSRVLSVTREKFSLSADNLITFLYWSPIFQEDKRVIVRDGLQAYLDGHHMTAAHLLIPQIEDAIRNLVELQGGAVLKKSRGGGLHLKTLDELLHESEVTAVIGEDAAFYFRVLLTNQRGWNLRNDVCHGIAPADVFNPMMTDRLLHVLLFLGRLRGDRGGDDNNEG